MKKEKEEDLYEIKGELLAGAVLFGGTKLAYEIGKDAFRWLKSDEKIFIQLLESRNADGHHIVKAKFASTYVHGLYVESLRIKSLESNDITFFDASHTDGISFGSRPGDRKEDPLIYPFFLLPSASKDIYIKIPEIGDENIKKKNGVELICEFSSIDQLKKTTTVKREIRLLWHNPSPDCVKTFRDFSS